MSVRSLCILALHRAGLNLSEIGEALGVSRQYVSIVLTEAGITQRHGRRTAECVAEGCAVRVALPSKFGRCKYHYTRWVRGWPEQPREPAGCGTRNRYAAGCRCSDCTEANRTSTREMIRTLQERFARTGQLPEGREHGQLYAYYYAGCRCPECRAVNAAHSRQRRERKAAR